jgi:23S rRNA (uridine2479-2'-O)-methyltransferase
VKGNTTVFTTSTPITVHFMTGRAHRTIRTENDEYQLALALLTNRKQRRKQRRFVVHGVKAITAALEHGWTFDSLWKPEGRALSGWARDVVASAASSCIEVAPPLFARLSDKDEPGELIAVLELPDDDLARIRLGEPANVVVCDRPASPGNLGSIVRSADAFGADGVIVTGHAADIYDPQAVRASIGALFTTPTVQIGSPTEVAEWIRGQDPEARIVGTSARAETSLDDLDLRGPLALVFGNETAGLSRAWAESCDVLVRIPISGAASSLNLAAAASIFMNEVRRQRKAHRTAGKTMPPAGIEPAHEV